MKHRNIVCLIIFFLSSIKALAYDFKVNGLCYNVLSENTVELTWEGVRITYKGDVVVPDRVRYNGQNYDVVRIGDYAMTRVTNFEDGKVTGCGSYSDQISVTLPSTIASIGKNSFCGVNRLQLINLPESLKEIGFGAFSGCVSLASINLPSQLNSIGNGAFSFCKSLISVVIPKSVTTIEGDLFMDCPNLVSINVEQGNIRYSSQNNCNAIIDNYTHSLISGCRNTVIPNNVTSIRSAFRYCTALESITIPSSVKDMNCAFEGCTGLTTITIPYNVKKLDNAFLGCANLSSVHSKIINPYAIFGTFVGISKDAILYVPKGTKSLYENTEGWNAAFKEIIEEDGGDVQPEIKTYDYDFKVDGLCYNILQGNTVELTWEGVGISYKGDVVVPERVRYNGQNYDVVRIGDYAMTRVTNFEDGDVMGVGGHSGLTSVTLPSTITSIGKSSFSYNSSLRSINLPESLKEIGAGAFSSCGSIGSINLPSQLISIGNDAFGSCESLTSVVIPKSVTSIEGNLFRDCPNLISINVEQGNIRYSSPNNCNAIVDNYTHALISGCKNTIIPDGVTNIDKAFQNCRELTSITIPSGVIGMSEAFTNCTALTSVTIPSSVTDMSSAFINCTSLTTVFIPNSVIDISVTFSGCTGLTSITILNSIKKMDSPFNRCSNLTTVHSKIINPFPVGSNPFEDISKDAILYVPKGTKALYENTEGWNTAFKQIIEEDGSDVQPEINSFTSNNINYVVTSTANKVVSVSNGNYNRKTLEVPNSVSYQNVEWKVTGIETSALTDCPKLAAVIWNPSASFSATVSNPNLLLYVTSANYAPSTIKNIVVNGVADNIVLVDDVDGNDFYCPQEFTARKISYTHHYGMSTGIDESRGWESIALPFDVQRIEHAGKGEIVPFAQWSSGSAKKPFWLMSLTAGGFAAASSIMANTPYIISMPNHPYYKNEYRLNGTVTFSSENARVKASNSIELSSGNGRTLLPSFTNLSITNALVLNVNNDYVTYSGGAAEGSQFIMGLRPLHPFEAYMLTQNNSRSVNISDGMATGIQEISEMVDYDKVIRVYSLGGQLILTEANKKLEEIEHLLQPGVYIVNGKKLIIK